MKVDSLLIWNEKFRHSHVSAIAYSKRQQKRILLKGNSIEKDKIEDGPARV
jgi:hypothetical protein